MKEFLMMFLTFMCGGFCGFIVAALFAVGSRADNELDEFDGGFKANHNNQLPPVRTTIWHPSIRERTDQ